LSDLRRPNRGRSLDVHLAVRRRAFQGAAPWIGKPGEKRWTYANTPEVICTHISKERIAALEERLRLGKDNQELITNEVERLKQEVSQQKTIIDNFQRSTDYAQ
jgi:hypothetical protein